MADFLIKPASLAGFVRAAIEKEPPSIDLIGVIDCRLAGVVVRDMGLRLDASTAILRRYWYPR